MEGDIMKEEAPVNITVRIPAISIPEEIESLKKELEATTDRCIRCGIESVIWKLENETLWD